MIVPYSGGGGTDPDAVHTNPPPGKKEIGNLWFDPDTGLPNFEVVA